VTRQDRPPTVLWWGRFDPAYSRNRILRRHLAGLGWQVRDFRPRFSATADLEAALRRLPSPDLVWVPAFRQRDMAAALRWSRSRRVPVLFDPLISAFDKQVDERGKLDSASRRARRLLRWERRIFQAADLVLADTPRHADYFSGTLGVPRSHTAVVYVGAEDGLFEPAPLDALPAATPPEVLFYGSFIPLQGPETIVEAARLYAGPPVRWTLLGDGPLRQACVDRARGLDSVRFEAPVPYARLGERIHRAHILLGVFGTTPKAGRVIPNKVFQALACARAVITRQAEAYPPSSSDARCSGLSFVPPGDPGNLARAVAHLAGTPEVLAGQALAARVTYQKQFGPEIVAGQLAAALAKLAKGPAHGA
jgi:glycosyltransferase involved in cell wall biosynthesis